MHKCVTISLTPISTDNVQGENLHLFINLTMTVLCVHMFWTMTVLYMVLFYIYRTMAVLYELLHHDSFFYMYWTMAVLHVLDHDSFACTGLWVFCMYWTMTLFTQWDTLKMSFQIFHTSFTSQFGWVLIKVQPGHSLLHPFWKIGQKAITCFHLNN